MFPLPTQRDRNFKVQLVFHQITMLLLDSPSPQSTLGARSESSSPWLGCSPKRVRCPGNSPLQMEKVLLRSLRWGPRRERSHGECGRGVTKRRIDSPPGKERWNRVVCPSCFKEGRQCHHSCSCDRQKPAHQLLRQVRRCGPTYLGSPSFRCSWIQVVPGCCQGSTSPFLLCSAHAHSLARDPAAPHTPISQKLGGPFEFHGGEGSP